MQIKKKISLINFTDKNDTSRIKYIVIHYFGGLFSAKAITNSWYDTYRGNSAHYAVDESDIYQIVEDEDISWHCGGGGTGVLKGICTNSNSIGIEVRPKKIDESTAKDASKRDWFFDSKTIDNVIELTKYLMNKYNVPIKNVIRHYDVTRKYCPRPFMGDDTNTYYNKTGNKLWQEFKARLINNIEDDDNLTQDTFNQMLKQSFEDLGLLEPSNWSEQAREWAESNGYIKGDETGNKKYKKPLTREEAIQIFHNILGK